MTQDLLQESDQTFDPNKDYLAEFIAPGGKFHDPDRDTAIKKVARGKAEADVLIKVLQRTQDELRADNNAYREQINKTRSLEELVDQLKTLKDVSPPNPNVNETRVVPPAIDETKIKSLVADQVQEIEMNRRQADNYRMVESKLQERFGNNYQNAVKQQIDALGITSQRLNEMARNEPQVLIKALGLDQAAPREPFQAPTRSSQRSDNFAPSTKKRTWADYQELRKSNPKLYHDPKTHIQMINDIKQIGEEAFYNVD